MHVFELIDTFTFCNIFPDEFPFKVPINPPRISIAAVESLVSRQGCNELGRDTTNIMCMGNYFVAMGLTCRT